jgi:hypothetical protein
MWRAAMIHLGELIAGVLGGVGLIVLAQTGISDVERFTGGGILVVVALLIVRSVMKASERIEALWTGAVASANLRADNAEQRLAQERKDHQDTEARYDQERQLRIRFETELAELRNQRD